MAGVCNTCEYFKANAHPGEEKPHHCAFQDVALSEPDSQQNCEECVPRKENEEAQN